MVGRSPEAQRDSTGPPHGNGATMLERSFPSRTRGSIGGAVLSAAVWQDKAGSTAAMSNVCTRI
jgi:hypothetical protein